MYFKLETDGLHPGARMRVSFAK